MLVRYWMTPDPVFVTENQTLHEAFQQMRKRDIRRLPVVRNDELKGILSMSDLYRYIDPTAATKDTLPKFMREELESRQVRQAMKSPPTTCDATDGIEDAADKMRRNKIGAIPVVRGTRLVGIITETDVFSALADLACFGDHGRRVCFRLDASQKKEVLIRVLEMCAEFRVELKTVLTHELHGEDDVFLVMMRFGGPDKDTFIDSLRDSEYQVLLVS